MNATPPPSKEGPAAGGIGHWSRAAQWRMRAQAGERLFLANWDRAVFMNYEVDAARLQPDVPFTLDLRDGKAHVSLVAFTLDQFRPAFGGRLGRWLCFPIRTQEFLNLRTYVRHRGERGIYFLTEWLSSRLAVPLGPATFGLPYRYADIRYEHHEETNRFRGCVAAGAGAFSYEGTLERGGSRAMCEEGALEEFLMERYIAFTSRRSRHRCFRVWHQPWRQSPMRLTIRDAGLIERRWPWFSDARFVGANYSPGVRDVWMGRPHRIRRLKRPDGSGALSAFFQLP